MSTITILLNILLKVSAKTIGKEKEVKHAHTKKEEINYLYLQKTWLLIEKILQNSAKSVVELISEFSNHIVHDQYLNSIVFLQSRSK